jgi:hypothetical protein
VNHWLRNTGPETWECMEVYFQACNLLHARMMWCANMRPLNCLPVPTGYKSLTWMLILSQVIRFHTEKITELEAAPLRRSYMQGTCVHYGTQSCACNNNCTACSTSEMGIPPRRKWGFPHIFPYQLSSVKHQRSSCILFNYIVSSAGYSLLLYVQFIYDAVSS